MSNTKTEILLDSFEKLKSKINDSDYDYLYSINKIIRALLGTDKELSVNIWEYCLEEFKHYEDDYYYCNHMWAIIKVPFEDYLRFCGIKNTINLLNTHPIIKNTIYERYYSFSDNYIQSLIKNNLLFELDEYLLKLENNKLFMKNHNTDDGIGEAIEYITHMMDCKPSSECIELLLSHAKLANEEHQAQINVNLIDYL